MPRRISPLLPATHERLRQLGERLRLARRRRRLPARQVAARAGMVPMTLRAVERGGAGVTIGAYVAVMQVLGVDQDLDLLVAADPVGRALQDARLSTPREIARGDSGASDTTGRGETAATATAASTSGRVRTPQAPAGKAPKKAAAAAGGFASAHDLAVLIDMPSKPRSQSSR